MSLPDTYKQVEYIESSGTQYIDTGISANQYLSFDVDFQSMGTTNKTTFFGARTGGGTNRFGLMIYEGKFHMMIGDTSTTSWDKTIDNNRHKGSVFLNNGAFTGTFDGNSDTGSAGTTVYVNKNFLLFKYDYSDSSGTYAACPMKLYYFKLYTGNSNLVRDFVPVIRKSDKKPGLYDLANNNFYTNAGTGEFTYKEYKESGKITHIYIGIDRIRPHKGPSNFYYSDENWDEYQSLVNSIGAVNFVDTGKRYRFNNPCYIGNRIAVNVNGTTFSKINIDTLTVISSKSSTVNGRIWYFGDNRILTRDGIMDFDGNMVTQFDRTYRMISPGLPYEIRANDDGYNMYRGIVEGDNVTFTRVGTSTANSGIGASAGDLIYGRLGAYSLGGTENSTHYIGFYNASTGAFSTITASMGSQHAGGTGQCMPDGKMYKHSLRQLGWGKLYKIGTSGEGTVGNQLSTERLSYGTRFGKFLGNIVSGGMGTNNGTGTGYGSNSYFINSNGTVTLTQSNALPYDTSIYLSAGFVDENGWIYPTTGGGGTGVILKTDKTITDFHRRNPYLWR